MRSLLLLVYPTFMLSIKADERCFLLTLLLSLAVLVLRPAGLTL